MKRFLRQSLTVILLTLMSVSANAQLGKFLKKAQKAVENVAGTVNNATGSSSKAVALASGGTIENPLSSAVDIDVVGLYGKSTSINYGEVYLVAKVTMKANKQQTGFGGWIDGKRMVALDQDGNSYTTGPAGWYNKQTPEGISVKAVLNDDACTFKDVKKSAKTMQMITLSVSLDYSTKGFVTLRNVPILWDVNPE